MSNQKKNLISNFFGSFSDAAVLFPLLILLGKKTEFQFPILFSSAGIMVVFSGIFFRVPMSVQPLKSIAIAAIAIGATSAEIQMSTLLLSLVFGLLLFLKIEKYLIKIPDNWIHALQVALGVLLLNQGIGAVSNNQLELLCVFLLSITLIFLTNKWSWPFLGLLATAALTYSFINGVDWLNPQKQAFHLLIGIDLTKIKWSVVANLLLPQLVLTMTNSVIATESTCKYYFENNKSFGNKIQSRVNKSNLIKTIIGCNFLTSFLGGLPMCHGSGGVTALYKGGARHWTSNLYLGAFLLFLSAVTLFYDFKSIEFPKIIFSTLLIVVGVYHLALAKQTWLSIEGKLRLLISILIVLFTRNLLMVLAFQVFLSLLSNSYEYLKRNYIYQFKN